LVVAMTTALACPASAQSLSDSIFDPANDAPPIGRWLTETKPAPASDTTVVPWTSSVVAMLPRKKSGPSFAGSRPFGSDGEEEGLRPKNDPLAGMASYYGKGEKTATGEDFDPSGMTAAHRTLPFGTRVKVTRVDNGDSVVVRINDRGPFKAGRVIDLSEGAAENLGITTAGLAPVKLEVLGQ
jgi:rare lipoprotein A